MPRVSTLDRHLSREAQAQLAAFLDTHPHTTVDQFREMLAAREVAIGRSAAGTAKQTLEAMGARLRQARLMMDSIAAGLDGEDESRHGRALLEVARTLVFEFQQRLLDGAGDEMSAAEFAQLGRTLKDLMHAARLDQDFAQRIEAEARARAAAAAGGAAARLGLSGDTAAAIRAAIEGVAP